MNIIHWMIQTSAKLHRAYSMKHIKWQDAVADSINKQVASGYSVERAVGAAYGEAWYACGLPSVDLARPHAAALIATRFDPELLDCRLPWPCFCVRVPDHLILREDGASAPFATHMFVFDVQASLGCERLPHPNVFLVTHWSDGFITMASRSTLFDGTEATVNTDSSVVASDEIRAVRSQANAIATDQAGLMVRVDLALRSLALSVALEMVEHRPAIAANKGRPYPINGRGHRNPATWKWKLSRDVKVDATRFVHDYISGKKSSVAAVQTMVRGHWKLQPCGEGSLQRKSIFVEPYWRGPEDGPLPMRSHVLSAETL